MKDPLQQSYRNIAQGSEASIESSISPHFLWLRLPPLLLLGQAYLARRNDIQPFVFKAFRPPSGMPF